MIVIVRPDDLLKVQDGVAEIIKLFERLGFVKVGFAECGWRLLCALRNLRQLIKVRQCLLRHLHLKEQESALHEALTHCLAVDFDCLGERNESLIVIADSLETIALAQVTQSIVLLQLNDGTEIAEGLFPLLLEDIDLASRNVGFNIARVPQQGLRKSPQRALVVVDSPIRYRKHNKHRFAIVGTLLDQVTQVCDRFGRLAAVQVGDGSVEQCIIIRFVHIETLGEHFDRFTILLLGKEHLS